MPRRRTIHFDTPRDLQRVTYRAIKSRGLCARCGSTPSPEGRCCPSCLADMTATKHQALAQGMCVDCWSVPALPGKRYCAQHAARRREQQRLTYGIRLVRKLCTRCGKKRAVKGKTLCLEHLQRNRQDKTQSKVRRLSNNSGKTTIE